MTNGHPARLTAGRVDRRALGQVASQTRRERGACPRPWKASSRCGSIGAHHPSACVRRFLRKSDQGGAGMAQDIAKIRNVAIVGHGGVGKTSLVESILL